MVYCYQSKAVGIIQQVEVGITGFLSHSFEVLKVRKQGATDKHFRCVASILASCSCVVCMTSNHISFEVEMV